MITIPVIDISPFEAGGPGAEAVVEAGGPGAGAVVDAVRRNRAAAGLVGCRRHARSTGSS